jgi:hypothetical protein
MRKTQISNQNEQKERKKIHTVRPAGSKIRRSFSYTIITKKKEKKKKVFFACSVAL